MDKPEGIVGRRRQWTALERFLLEGWSPAPEASAGTLRLGLVSGRRRTGKTQLLTAACDAVGGLYAVCVQDEAHRAPRPRVAAALGGHAGRAPASSPGPAEWC